MTLPLVSLALAWGAAGCRGGDRPPPPAAAARPAPAAASPEPASQTPRLFPPRLEQWRLSGPIRQYSGRRLYQHINGGADNYLAHGFNASFAASYSPGAGAGGGIKADIFEMTSPLAAFGIFASEQQADAGPLAAGVQGWRTDSLAAFWQDRFYVKVTAMTAPGGEERAMAQLARAISGRIGEPGEPPAQLALFPAAGRVPGSIRYHAKNFLGLPRMTAIFSARYRVGEQRPLLFFSQRADAGEARRLSREVAALPGSVAATVLAAPAEVRLIRGKYLGKGLLLARQGAWLAGARDFSDHRQVVPLLLRLLAAAGLPQKPR